MGNATWEGEVGTYAVTAEDLGTLAAVGGQAYNVTSTATSGGAEKITSHQRLERPDDDEAIVKHQSGSPVFDLFAAPFQGPPERPCSDCKGLLYWESRWKLVLCATCHPPVSSNLIRGWYDLSPMDPPGEVDP